MPKRITRYLISLISCVILLAGGVLGWALFYLDSEDFKEDVTAAMSRFMGREVVINGPMRFKLYPWLALSARNVTVGQVAGFGEEPFLHVDELSLGVKVVPLLHNELALDSTEFRGAHVRLRRLANGTVNYADVYELLFGTNFPFETFGLEGLAVRESSFSYRDDVDNVDLQGRGVRIATGEVQFGAPLEYEAGFQVEGSLPESVEVNATLNGELLLSEAGNVQAMTRTEAEVALAGDVSPGDRLLQVEGVADYDLDRGELRVSNATIASHGLTAQGWLHGSDLDDSPAWRGRLEVEDFFLGPAMRRLAPKAGLADQTEVLEVERLVFGFFRNASRVELRGLEARVDGAELRGGLVWRHEGPRNCNIAMRSQSLDLEEYAGVLEPGRDITAGKFIRWVEEVMAAWTARCDLRCESLSSGDVEAGASRLRLRLQDRELAVNASLEAISGGSLEAGLEASMRRGEKRNLWTARLRARSKSTDLADVQKFFNVQPVVRGQADAVLDLSAGEAPLAALAGTALGSIQVEATGGAVLWPGESDRAPEETPFSKVQVEVDFKKEPAGRDFLKDGYGRQVDASLLVNGVKPDSSLSVTLQGPMEAAADACRLAGRGAELEAVLRNGPLPKQSPEARLSAEVHFDTQGGKLDMDDVVLRALGLEIRSVIQAERVFSRNVVATGSLNSGDVDLTRLGRMYDWGLTRWAEAGRLKRLSLSGRLDLDRERARLEKARFRLDDTILHGFVELAEPFELENNRLRFNMKGVALDLDSYLFPSPPEKEKKKVEQPPDAAQEAKPAKVPLDALRSLDFQGRLRLRRLLFLDTSFEDVRIPLNARGGNVEAGPMNGKFYQGTFNASLSGAASPNRLDAALKLVLNDFRAGPFMTDLAGRDYVRGLADMDFDLHAVGADTDQLLANMRGTAGFTVRDGSFKFNNWKLVNATNEPPPVLRRPAPSDEPGEQAARRNLFSKARARFQGKGGVFRLTAFNLDSLLLDGEGEGSLSLPDNAIDLTLYARFVAAPEAPIRITGKLSDPDVHVSAQGMVTKTIKNILGIPLKPIKLLKDLLFGD